MAMGTGERSLGVTVTISIHQCAIYSVPAHSRCGYCQRTQTPGETGPLIPTNRPRDGLGCGDGGDI